MFGGLPIHPGLRRRLFSVDLTPVVATRFASNEDDQCKDAKASRRTQFTKHSSGANTTRRICRYEMAGLRMLSSTLTNAGSMLTMKPLDNKRLSILSEKTKDHS